MWRPRTQAGFALRAAPAPASWPAGTGHQNCPRQFRTRTSAEPRMAKRWPRPTSLKQRCRDESKSEKCTAAPHSHESTWVERQRPGQALSRPRHWRLTRTPPELGMPCKPSPTPSIPRRVKPTPKLACRKRGPCSFASLVRCHVIQPVVLQRHRSVRQPAKFRHVLPAFRRVASVPRATDRPQRDTADCGSFHIQGWTPAAAAQRQCRSTIPLAVELKLNRSLLGADLTWALASLPVLFVASSSRSAVAQESPSCAGSASYQVFLNSRGSEFVKKQKIFAMNVDHTIAGRWGVHLDQQPHTNLGWALPQISTTRHRMESTAARKRSCPVNRSACHHPKRQLRRMRAQRHVHVMCWARTLEPTKRCAGARVPTWHATRRTARHAFWAAAMRCHYGHGVLQAYWRRHHAHKATGHVLRSKDSQHGRVALQMRLGYRQRRHPGHHHYWGRVHAREQRHGRASAATCSSSCWAAHLVPLLCAVSTAVVAAAGVCVRVLGVRHAQRHYLARVRARLQRHRVLHLLHSHLHVSRRKRVRQHAIPSVRCCHGGRRMAMQRQRQHRCRRVGRHTVLCAMLAPQHVA
eukprot:366444-Chlamydomonas_euryale.AAC.28